MSNFFCEFFYIKVKKPLIKGTPSSSTFPINCFKIIMIPSCIDKSARQPAGWHSSSL